MNRSIVFNIILTLVLVAAVIGIGAYAYNAGVVNGLAQNAQPAGADGLKGTYPYYGYGMPFMHPLGFPGFGFLGCLIPLFLIFLFFGTMRALVWGPRHWGGHMMHHGRWGHDGESVPPMFQEWHRRAHEQKPEEPADK